jgi:hypothetical protein
VADLSPGPPDGPPAHDRKLGIRRRVMADLAAPGPPLQARRHGPHAWRRRGCVHLHLPNLRRLSHRQRSAELAGSHRARAQAARRALRALRRSGHREAPGRRCVEGRARAGAFARHRPRPLAQGIFRRQRGAAEPGVAVRREPLRERGRLERLHMRPQPRVWPARRHGRNVPIGRAALDEQRRRRQVKDVHGERRYARANTHTRPGSPLHSTTARPWSPTRCGRELVS